MAEEPVRGFVVVTLRFHKEGRYWLGECEELGTATDGRSLDDVKRELLKLVGLHLDGLQAIGELERVLVERHLKLYPDQPPAEVGRTVPVSLDGETDDSLLQYRSVPIPIRHDAAVTP